MADVEIVIDALRQTSINGQWVVILKEKGAERYLPVWIGSSQADTIRRELMDDDSTKPLRKDPVCKVISTPRPKVKAVKLYKFEGNRFSARLVTTAPDKPCEADCPLAVALAIALRENVPIVASEEVLEKAGISLPV